MIFYILIFGYNLGIKFLITMCIPEKCVIFAYKYSPNTVMLRIVRIVLAVFSILTLTLLFLDFTGVTQGCFGWLSRFQFIPALLSMNLIAIISLIIVTLILGRVYCSVICPLGVLQDVINHIRGWFGKKKNRTNRFKYSEPKTWLRLSVMSLFILLIILGVANVTMTAVATFVEPYSIYGRIASSLIAPVYDAGNNLIADYAETQGSYDYYHVETYVSIPIMIVSIISLVIIGSIAWLGGRTYCNTMCPVGTILGYLSRYSLLKPFIDTDKCNGCRKCERNCKSSCIDAKNHAIDYTRCVACMNCLNKCSTGAITYTYRRKSSLKDAKLDNKRCEINEERRNFFTVGAMVATAAVAKATDKTIDGGLATIIDKKQPSRAVRVVPPGAMGLSHLERHCTACQLCITACPNGVLRPSTELSTFMQPVVGYENGYCRPECVKCSSVCPAGAFHPITVAQKSSIQIGRAIVRLDACLVAAEGKHCGSCAKHCPSEAITMAPINPDDPTSHWMPVVNETKCIGCGACEYLCPVRPLSAIYVEGNIEHKTI